MRPLPFAESHFINVISLLRHVAIENIHFQSRRYRHFPADRDKRGTTRFARVFGTGFRENGRRIFPHFMRKTLAPYAIERFACAVKIALPKACFSAGEPGCAAAPGLCLTDSETFQAAAYEAAD